MNWVYYGLGSSISFAAMALTLKKVFELGVSPIVAAFYLFILTAAGYSIWVPFKMSVKIGVLIIPWLVLASVFSLLGNYFDLTALKLAPNPGYASTLKATQIIIITLVAPFLFSSSLTPLKMFGVFLVLTGAALIAVSK